MRFFNTAGPVNCQDHYCLPPLQRFDLDTVMSLIGQKKYFLLHAPRQTGKTSCLLALMTHLNQGGIYRALYANIEGRARRCDGRNRSRCAGHCRTRQNDVGRNRDQRPGTRSAGTTGRGHSLADVSVVLV